MPADPPSHPLEPSSAPQAAIGGCVVLAALVHLALFWPGILVWDAIRQYGQALSGRYDDWHPPAMNWLWRHLLALHDGPAAMLALQVLLYWSGFLLLAHAALRRGPHASAIALGLVALLPIPLVLVGTVLKDSLMAGLLLLALGLATLRAWHMRAAAAGLLLAAATLRFNAAPACLPLVWLLLPAEWRIVRRVGAMVLALALLVAAMPVANRLLRAERSGVELSLVIYDLAGITRYGGADAFPPLPVRDAVTVNRRCYDPVSWDRYAWWGDDPCPINFAPVRSALGSRNAYAWWLHAIAAHPLAYAEHRLEHFNNNVRFLIHDADEPTLSLRSDPNRWAFALPPGRARDAIGTAAAWSLRMPLGWPACWLALGLGVLILAPAAPKPGRFVPVASSALLYGFSYLPLSVASEVRYHLWTMLGVAIATVFAAEQAWHGERPTRLRVAAAAAPVVIVTSLAVLSRLL